MAIEIHPEARKKLEEAVADAIRSVVVENNFYPNSESLKAFQRADKVLPSNGKLRDKLVQYFDDFPASEFFSSEIRRDLYPRPYEADGEDKLLTTCEGFEDPEAVAVDLVERFSSLPWRYSFIVKLPDWFGDHLDAGELIPIGSCAEVVRFSRDQFDQFKLESSRSVISAGDKSSFYSWEDGTYFRTYVNGYVTHRYGAIARKVADSRLRAFFGMSISESLAWVKRRLAKDDKGSRFFVVHIDRGDSWEHHGIDELSSDLTRTISELAMVSRDDDRRSYMDMQFKDISVAFGEGRSEERLQLAAQWLFDSYTSDSEMLSFIQAMVVLEILLGDKSDSEKIGLGELLKNRCAYLIGTDQQDRDNILHDFPAIYQVRSKIVHAGKSRMDRDDLARFYKLRNYCMRVLRKEREFIQRSSGKSAPVT